MPPLAMASRAPRSSAGASVAIGASRQPRRDALFFPNQAQVDEGSSQKSLMIEPSQMAYCYSRQNMADWLGANLLNPAPRWVCSRGDRSACWSSFVTWGLIWLSHNDPVVPADAPPSRRLLMIRKIFVLEEFPRRRIVYGAGHPV